MESGNPTNKKSGITTRTIHDISEFEELRDDWVELFRESNCQEIFLSWEWSYTWWKYHRDEKHLWLITVWRENKLCGIAPFMLIKRAKYGLKFRSLTSLGHPDNDISGFIMHKNEMEIVRAICNHLTMHSNNWDVLEIKELPGDSLAGKEFSSLMEKSGYITFEKNSPHYYVPITSDWRSYYEKLPRKMRKTVKSRLNKARKKGEISFKAYEGKELTWDHFLAVFEVNKQSRFPHVFQSEQRRQFFNDLFNLTRGNNWIEISLLEFDNKPIAYNIGFTLDGRFEGWHQGFDSQFAQLSPGAIAFMFFMEEYFNRGFREIDFLRGDESYKNEWNTLPREFLDIRIVKSTKLISALAFIWLPKLNRLIKKRQTEKEVSPS